MTDVFVDLYVEKVTKRYHVYGIGRGGEKRFLGEHAPWFALYIPHKDAEAVVADLKKMPHVIDAKVLSAIERTPLLPLFYYKYEPSPDYKMVRVFVEDKVYVPHVAMSAKRRYPGSFIGVSNIVYPVRVSFDFDVKYFHPACPIIFRPNSELEQLTIEVIEGSKNLKVMAFDIEVATSPGRFPKPGDQIISIQFATMRLDDESFSEPSWPRDNVQILMAEGLSESEALVEEFLDALRKERPDVLVGYNSLNFDVKYMMPFVRKPMALRDWKHFYLSDIIIPHVDLYVAQKSMGPSLGLRSQRLGTLDGVVKELVKGSELEWVLASRYMLAEERLDHTKIVEEWRGRTQLFYDYVTADVYLTLIIARLWMLTFVLLSSLVQMPLTEITRLNLGQVAEYNIVHWLEKLGFEPALVERTREFRKVSSLGIFAKHLKEEEGELFKRGKVYVKDYGVFKHVLEGDFAQLYPTLMANEVLDPTALRVSKFISKNTVVSTVYADPTVEKKVAEKAFPVLLGSRTSKSAETMEPTELYVVIPTFGPVSFLLFKMFQMRRITKKLKKKSKEVGKPELAIPDQAVKILNNASYGAFSKQRGFINQVLSAYIFWKTLKILYDVIDYAEKKLGVTVLYGDTDSIFVQCKVDEAAELYPNLQVSDACKRWFAEHILPKLNEYVRSRYGKEFEIEFEDYFDVCIYPKLKKGHGASRKSYICGNYDESGRLRVEVFKGDFYKAVAPEGIREKLAEFYEDVIARKPTSDAEVAEIMKEILRSQPLHKWFVKKIVDSFISEKEEEEEEVECTLKVKNLNKPFHFAALHIAYAMGLPGVTVAKLFRTGGAVTVEYSVDVQRVFETGSIVAHFLPGPTPREFTVYIDYDDSTGLVKLHKVKVSHVEPVKVVESKKVVKETGYRVVETYIEELVPKEELVNKVIKSMKNYILDDIVKKLLPALFKAGGGSFRSLLPQKAAASGDGK